MSDLRDLERASTTVAEVQAFVGQSVRVDNDVHTIRALRYSHGGGWLLDLVGRNAPVPIADARLSPTPLTSDEAFQGAANAKRRDGQP